MWKLGLEEDVDRISEDSGSRVDGTQFVAEHDVSVEHGFAEPRWRWSSPHLAL